MGEVTRLETRSHSGVQCTRFQPVRRGKSLRGYADLFLPRWMLHFKGCSVHALGNRRWVNLPTRAIVERDSQTTRYKPKAARCRKGSPAWPPTPLRNSRPMLSTRRRADVGEAKRKRYAKPFAAVAASPDDAAWFSAYSERTCRIRLIPDAELAWHAQRGDNVEPSDPDDLLLMVVERRWGLLCYSFIAGGAHFLHADEATARVVADAVNLELGRGP